MVNYWRLVNDVIDGAEILLLVIDARMPEMTRHREIESKIKQREKPLLYVINKCDLVGRDTLDAMKHEFSPAIFVSSKAKLGGTILMKKILEISRGKPVIVGVLGYPNVGKSSVINLLRGQKSASVSPHSGHTKGIQFIKAKGKIKMLDTPGVLPFGEDDLLKQVIIGSKNPEHLKEPDFFAMKLIELYPRLFEEFYSLKYNGDAFDFLEQVALKQKVLIKGGSADMPRASRQLLYDFQRGKMHEFILKHQKTS